MRKWLLGLLGFVLVVYGVLCAGLYSKQRSLMYFPQPLSKGAQVHTRALDGTDPGIRISVRDVDGADAGHLSLRQPCLTFHPTSLHKQMDLPPPLLLHRRIHRRQHPSLSRRWASIANKTATCPSASTRVILPLRAMLTQKTPSRLPTCRVS